MIQIVKNKNKESVFYKREREILIKEIMNHNYLRTKPECKFQSDVTSNHISQN